MQLGEYIYLINGSICLAIAILLLSTKDSSENVRAGIHSKRYLIIASLVCVLTTALAVALNLYGLPTDVVPSVVIPAAALTQLQLIGYSILERTHARSWLFRQKALSLLPLPLAAGLYFSAEQGLLDKRLVSPILYGVYALSFMVHCAVLALKSYHFIGKRKKDKEDTACRREVFIIGLEYICYFGLTFVFWGAQTHPTYPLLASLIGTAIFLHWGTIAIDQSRENFIVVRPIESTPPQKNSLEHPENQEEDKEEFSEHNITKAILLWEKRPEKPYLKEGIAVADVANQLGIAEVQLSFVLNHSLHQNFSSWINRLRIEEAKWLLRQNPQMTIVDVAYASGFSDANTFSRNFKKQTGISPSAYKTALNNEGTEA